jgi:MFS family permease
MKQILRIQRELVYITAALSLFGTASSLVGVFIPLIILHSGRSLTVVAGFYIAYAIIKLIFNYPTVRVIQRFGAHIALGCGFLAGALQMVSILLFNQTHSIWALLGGAGALAMTNAFLWNSMHVHISKIMDRTTKSSSMATMNIIQQVTSVAAPLIGGFIAAAFGSQWVLILALAFALVALVPLQRMGHLEDDGTPKVPIIYNLMGAPPRDLFANFCFNIDTTVGVMLWPVYLAVTIANFKAIGAISGVSALAAIIMTAIAGHRGDKGHDRSVLRQGITASSLIHVLRLLAVTPLTITFLSVGYRSALAYFQNAWASTYYSHAKDEGVNYVMSMEIACDLAYIFFWGIMFLCALTGSRKLLFDVGFLIAASAAWGCLLIKPQGHFEIQID